MTDRGYVGLESPEAIERARLEQLERISDPVTRGRLEKLGVARGWRCLEVGAGRGSIARWLADRVGPEGRVVATDLDPRFLDDLTLPNVEVRAHDVLATPFEPGAYD